MLVAKDVLAGCCHGALGNASPSCSMLCLQLWTQVIFDNVTTVQNTSTCLLSACTICPEPWTLVSRVPMYGKLWAISYDSSCFCGCSCSSKCLYCHHYVHFTECNHNFLIYVILYDASLVILWIAILWIYEFLQLTVVSHPHLVTTELSYLSHYLQPCWCKLLIMVLSNKYQCLNF